MSHSRKDGRRGGGHRPHRYEDFWSRRLPGYPPRVTYYKRQTHRKERRAAHEVEYAARTSRETTDPRTYTPEEDRHHARMEAINDAAMDGEVAWGEMCDAREGK